MRQKTILTFIFGTTVLILINWFWVLRASFNVPFDRVEAESSQVHFSWHQLSDDCENQIRVIVKTCALQMQAFSSVASESVTTLRAQKPAARKFLTIGIPSVERKKSNYLTQTLNSLVDKSTPEEKKNTTVVILLADGDASVRQKRTKEIESAYSEHLESGFFVVVSPPENIYPKTKISRRTYSDPEKRVRWRAKQVLDFAFLFNHSSDLSEHFLILEDDVLAASHYITAIMDFVSTQKREWVSLTFSGFLIIGRLLKNSDLGRLVKFLTLFYVEKPVDLLIMQFIDLLVPDSRAITRRVPSLFQHIGIHSSLDGKVQKLQDKSFVDEKKQFGIRNPFADILTTMELYGNFLPELAYSSAYGYFWAKSPKANSTFDIVFQQPHRLDRIYIKTGSTSHKDDILVNGVLEASPHFVAMTSSNKASCENFTVLSRFENGVADVRNVTLGMVQCIRLRCLEKQKQWLVLLEIAIFKASRR